MFLSVIIPVYNGESHIAGCMAALEAQTRRDFEVIFVNDGSTDSTARRLDAIESDLDIRVVTRPNGGVSAARNAGLDLARGRYVYFLDVDDTIEPDTMELVGRAAEASAPDCIIFGFDLVRDGCVVRKFLRSSVLPPPIGEFLRFRLRIGIWSVVWDSNLLKDNGLRFDEATAYGEDREMTAAALLHCRSWEYIPRVLLHYRLHPSSASHRPFSLRSLSSLHAVERTARRCASTPWRRAAELNLYVTLLKNYAHYLRSGAGLPEADAEFADFFRRWPAPEFEWSRVWFIARPLLAVRRRSPALFRRLARFI